ncbi:MAG: DinB family protein [Chloroflexi bacterium]|nr:DinB family protein [Chloroflexota bacterium]
MPTEKQQVLQQLEGSWNRFLAAVQKVPSARMEEQGVIGAWSAKDIMGHISTWEDEAVKGVQLLLEGKPQPRYGNVDQWNQQAAEQRRALTPKQAAEALRRTHTRTVELLQGLPEQAYQQDAVRRFLLMETTEHYDEHGADLLRWLGQQAKS